MKYKTPLSATLLLSIALSISATQSVRSDPGVQYDQGDLYRAHELSLDVFGSASLGKDAVEHLSGSKIRHDSKLGAGAGLNYYITRNVGVGADAYSEDTTGAFIDSASASLLLRFPLGASGFAPYALGGGGHQFDMDEEWFAQFGAGLEYRFKPRAGIFLDARWVIPEEAKNYAVARLGFRFSF